ADVDGRLHGPDQQRQLAGLGLVDHAALALELTDAHALAERELLPARRRGALAGRERPSGGGQLAPEGREARGGVDGTLGLGERTALELSRGEAELRFAQRRACSVHFGHQLAHVPLERFALARLPALL